LAAVLVLVNNVRVQYGSTIAVAVFAHLDCKAIQAICVSTIRNQRKAAAEAKVCIVTNVVVIKVAVCQVFGRAATAALAVLIHTKAVLLFTNMDTWHSACSHTAHDATQIIVLDQLQFPHVV
jgi:hypothetical protein